MTTVQNSFEGGTSGTTISTGNSGGTSGTAFDVISIGAAATLAFSGTRAAHGTLSCQVATGASSVSSYAEWSTSMGSHTQVWFRLYLYFTALPSASTAIWRAYQGTQQVCGLNLQTSTGQLRMEDSSNAEIFGTTAPAPTGRWFRLEGFVIASASAGQVQLKLYDNADSTIPTETDTSAATVNTFGAPDNYRFGAVTSAANIGPFWMDSIGLSSTGYLGPAVAPRAASIVPSLVAAGVLS